MSTPPILSPPPLYEFEVNNPPGQSNDAEPPAYSFGGVGSSGRVVRSRTASLDLTEHAERFLRGERASSVRKEFTYDLVKGKEKEGKKPWAFLTVMGDSDLTLSKKVPVVVEGEKVEGELKVDLDGSESFQAAIITVRGQIIGGAQSNDILTFLEISKVLWSSSPNPLSSTSKAANLLPGPKQKLDKLNPGSHSWPFSINLPKEVALTVGPKDAPRVEVCRLPQTFFERHARARVQYEVIARFVRGFLKTDWRLSTEFSYIPITVPPSPSPLRVLAYQENTPLLGPEADPEGWITLDPVTIRGGTEWKKEVEAKYIVSAHDSSQLSYTRGSVIPLSLVIKCGDRRTLELLSSTRSIVVRLRRCLRYHSDDRRSPEAYQWTDEFEFSELATWWPDSLVHSRARATSNNLLRLDSEINAVQAARTNDSGFNAENRQSSVAREGRNDQSRSRARSSQGEDREGDCEGEGEGPQERDLGEGRMRVLKGEIHLQNDLKPSTAIDEYSVVLFPPDINGFQFDSSSSSSQKGDILLSQPVEITTAFALGPRPRMYSPPQYESSFPEQSFMQISDRVVTSYHQVDSSSNSLILTVEALKGGFAEYSVEASPQKAVSGRSRSHPAPPEYSSVWPSLRRGSNTRPQDLQSHAIPLSYADDVISASKIHKLLTTMMDVDEQEYQSTTAPSTSRGLPVIVPVDEAHPFDLEFYISNYTGRAAIDRLIHIVSLCPHLAVEAYGLALQRIQRSRDPSVYQALCNAYDHISSHPDAVNVYKLRLPPLSELPTINTKWAEDTAKKNHLEKMKLEAELKNYSNNMIKESIRMGHRDLAEFCRSTGDYPSALKHWTKSREFCSTSQHVLDGCLSVLELLIEQKNYSHIPTYVFKAEAALEAATAAANSNNSGGKDSSAPAASAAGSRKVSAISGDRELVQSKLEFATALSQLAQGNYERAAYHFLRIAPSSTGIGGGLGDWFGKLVSAGDVAIYGTLCALASLSRSAFKAQVIENLSFSVYIEQESYVREMIEAYMASNFKGVLESLSKYNTRHTLDPHLFVHLSSLLTLTRTRLVTLYFAPFSTIKLDRMATAFGWSMTDTEDFVVDLVRKGEIAGRVDSREKVLRVRREEEKAVRVEVGTVGQGRLM
ncbi:hypothetical protein D9758_013309 [Tetrapyrgos nigripes]|uniref:PCI domain-containing protein n=1 Tax=Tetrapyrgos nigripes TaxID=182062 RepID=A0A8H5CCN0_9AGAR|nr:hypothetical protein D9758_013309 [Tetrapyrgos nigripes]